MHEFLHVLLEAFIDTTKVLPFLFIVYYIIELIEFKCAISFKNNKFLKGKSGPVFGSIIGCVPQCGFSIISTDMYSKKYISIGTLIAVYIATSDEALPLMLSEPKFIPWMFLLIAIKVVFGIAVGYLSIVLYKLIFKKKVEVHENHDHHYHNDEHDHEEHDDHEEVSFGGCCNHSVETKSYDWKHPLLHCLKISAFIFAINLIFTCITHIWIGEERLANFLNGSLALQPILAVLVGLIPNCASSVAITKLFMLGGLSFGSLVAGLSVNAGIGLVVLFKQNKNWKENLFIILMMIVPSLMLGYALNFI